MEEIADMLKPRLQSGSNLLLVFVEIEQFDKLPPINQCFSLEVAVVE